MSDDKIQRAIEFLLEQQAKFDARQQAAQQEMITSQQDMRKMQTEMYEMRQDMHTMQREIHFLQNQQVVSQKNAEEDRNAIYTLAKNTEQGFLEIREAIAHLIVINERLSKVSKQLTKGLANTNKRVKALENKAKS